MSVRHRRLQETTMNHRDPHQPGDRQQSNQASQRPSPRDNALYDGLPAVTNRQWGADRSDDASTYGYPGQGGYGDFTRDHQGGFGESQGAHAQSGHGRGGAASAGRRDGDPVSRGVPVRGSGGHRGRGPQGYTRSDDRIVDDVIDRLTDDDQIDASEILVMVEGGVVTLSGNVPERQMKHRAEDLVADANGVRDVENRIRVDDGSASAGRPGEAVRSGRDQLGSGFSSSARPDPVYDNPTEDSNWPGQ
jgi:osmotically-inducible protein OsmY